MTVTTIERAATQPQVLQKTVGGKTVTLTPEQAEAFGRELDALKERVIADLGERDSTYIRRIIKAQRTLEVGGRATLFGGIFPPFWLAGILAPLVRRRELVLVTMEPDRVTARGHGSAAMVGVLEAYLLGEERPTLAAHLRELAARSTPSH